MQVGLKNPYRVKDLIKKAIDFHKLDLNGLIVFTEAASRNYIVTPIIAAMAGAKVYAIASDSKYGLSKDIEKFTYDFAEFCGIKDRIKIVFDKKEEIISQANIVTNLGFVRPIDRNFVNMMNDTAVIPFMYEAWEYREGDVDLDACRFKGIPVLATNEDALGLEVFDYVGPLCIKMLFELEIEVLRSKIVIVSNNKFGEVIKKYLKKIGADVVLTNNLQSEEALRQLKDCDALIVAGFKNNETIIGKNGQLSAKKLVEASRKISVIQFSGDIKIEELEKYNIQYFPQQRIGKFRMGMTLAELGPKPIINLYCAGLKIGEIMAKLRQRDYSIEKTIKIALENPLCQNFT